MMKKLFDMVGPHAPQDVKDAWMEAAKEVNANGAGIKKNGMMSHEYGIKDMCEDSWRWQKNNPKGYED